MSSYKDILKSSGIIGIVQIAQMFFGLLRNKIIAILLGTNGIGLWGLFQTYIEMFSTFSLLGMDQSGVRLISKKANDKVSQAKCILTFRNFIFLISLLFLFISILFSKFISNSLFGTDSYHKGIIIASLVIVCNSFSRGQTSILNALRDLKGLSLSQIIGSITGTLLSIIIILISGKNAIPWAFFIGGVSLSISTHWYVKKLNIQRIIPSFKEVFSDVKELLNIGLAFACAGVVSVIMTYFSRVFLTNEFDISTVGIYMASWTISNLYIGIILNAMGVDFMPRLMTISEDNQKINSLVNEQMELGVLLSSIAVVGILFFSQIILNILYSSEFLSGANIIRWQVLGVGMRVLAFPFGFVIMAKGKSVLYITIQTIFWIGEYLLLLFFANKYGFNGLGVNYFVGYLGYLCMVVISGYFLFSFRTSKLLLRILFISWGIIFISWIITTYLPWNYT
ncbi:MAG: oligosaccharide flippase family protein [Tannerellaceae bacterium]|nr:oligosaccharide flippase family protein [Tannerellaceae bacterium]